MTSEQVISFIRGIMDEKKIKIKELAEMIGRNERGLYETFQKGTLKLPDLLLIAEGLEVQPFVFFVGRSSGSDSPTDAPEGRKLSKLELLLSTEVTELKAKLEAEQKTNRAKQALIDQLT